MEGRPDKNCKYYLWTLKLEKVLRLQHTPAAIVPAPPGSLVADKACSWFLFGPCGNCRTLNRTVEGSPSFVAPLRHGEIHQTSDIAKNHSTTRVAITKYHIYIHIYMQIYIVLCILMYIIYYIKYVYIYMQIFPLARTSLPCWHDFCTPGIYWSGLQTVSISATRWRSFWEG